jgi:hypothetical protein
MAAGIPPREASDRLTIFQARFDELWRKYETYSGGEELFGLPVTQYNDIARIKKVKAVFGKITNLRKNNIFVKGTQSITKTLWFVQSSNRHNKWIL